MCIRDSLRAAQIALARRGGNRALGHLLRRERHGLAHAVDEQNRQPVREQLDKGGRILDGVGLGGDTALGQQVDAQSLAAAQHGRVAVEHIQRHPAELFRRGQPREHDDGAWYACNHQALGIKIVGAAKPLFQKGKVRVQRTVQLLRHRCSPPLTQDSVAGFAKVYEEAAGCLLYTSRCV